MKYTTFTHEAFHGAGISRSGDRIFYAKLSVDLHESHTAHRQAIETLYPGALLAGAGQYDRAAFLDAVNLIGGSINVRIGNGVCTFTLRSRSEQAEALLKLFAIMIEKPTFAPKEIKRLKLLAHNELLESEEDAAGMASHLFGNALYNKTDRRFQELPNAMYTELPTVTAAELRQFHTLLRQGHWAVTVGAPAALIKQTEATVAKLLHKKRHTPARTHAPRPVTAKLLLHQIPSKENIEFNIGSLLPLTFTDPDYLPFIFGLSVLGRWGGFSGRLMSTVREKEGLTYGIYARAEAADKHEYGFWRIVTFFAPDKAKQGLTSTLREISKIHDKGITKDEYDRYRIILKTEQDMLQDSFTSQVRQLHAFIAEDFTLEEMEAFKARLLTITQKEINDALKKYLDPDKLIITGAGPVTKAKKELTSIYPPQNKK